MIIFSKDNKRLVNYLGIILIAVLLTYRLPHDSYSTIQYIIRPIRLNSSVIYLSGLIPLVLFIMGIKGLFSLERFAYKNKILLFLIVVMIVIPFMKWTIDFTRTNYHWLMGGGLRAVDIVKSNIDLQGSNDDVTINFNLEIIDYSRGRNQFKIRAYLPKALSDYVGKEYCEFEKDYVTHGNRSTINIKEQIVIESSNDTVRRTLFDSKWYREEVKYELYNEKEAVKIINHGL